MDKLVSAMRAFACRTNLELDLIRIYLGAALFVRGVLFLSHPDLVLNYIGRGGGWFWPAAIAHYVAFAHLSGGFLLAIGLLTRFAAGVQVPVLLGAVSCASIRQGLFWTGGSPELAALVLFLLLIFSIFGSGPWSADHLLTHPKAESMGTTGCILL